MKKMSVSVDRISLVFVRSFARVKTFLSTQGGAADSRDPELASASGSVQRLQGEALRRSGLSEQSQSAQGRSHRLRPTFPHSRTALSVVDAAAERTIL